MNISIALMFIGVVAGVEVVDRLIPGRAASLRIALADWNSQALRDSVGGTRVLLVIAACLTSFLAWISFSEGHLGTIGSFLSITGDEAARLRSV